ncbi:MAG TPA: flagellar filament capping protein FliD [Spirochaetia bacterium]|nr:flagellar filament capping protein FliD [Spirochaetia bacterium]
MAVLLAVAAPLSFAQSTGSFTIPGVTDQYNTDQMINKIMKYEAAPVDRMKGNVDGYKKEKAVWSDLGQKLSKLQDSAKKLYGFQNPFNERMASSSNDAVLTATATRQAQEHKNTIIVKQLAGADSFLSKDLPLDYHVPAGTYTFKVGDAEKTFAFRGGKLSEFADALNRYGAPLISANVVRNTQSTQVLMVASEKSGAKNRLQFLKDAAAFAVDAGILQKVLSNSRDLVISGSTVAGWTVPLDQTNVTVADGTVTLSPGTEASLPVTPPVAFSGKMELSLEISVTNLGGSAIAAPVPPPGPSVPSPGSATLDGVTVHSNNSQAPLPQWKPPEPPKIIVDHQIIFAQNGVDAIPLPDVPDTDGFQQLTIPISDYVHGMTALDIRNRNTGRRVEVRNVRIYDPQSRGDYRAVNPVSAAQDAKLTVDGIDAVRDSNTITDLVPGTTLQLQSTSTVPVALTVEPDRKLVKDSIIEFVGRYNQLLTQINIVSNKTPDVVDEVTYFTPDEKKQAMDQLGLLQGDMTMSMLKSRLQNAMMGPYPTDLGHQLTLLAQIGISTNTGGFGQQSYDASRLRGYLEINEQALDAAIKDHLPEVKQLFGSDTNGDLVMDNGVSVKIDDLVTPYVQVGGIIAIRSQGLDTRIASTNKEIDDLNKRLDQKRVDLRDQFARMQGAMGDLQKQSQTLNGLGGQSGASGGR